MSSCGPSPACQRMDYIKFPNIFVATVITKRKDGEIVLPTDKTRTFSVLWSNMESEYIKQSACPAVISDLFIGADAVKLSSQKLTLL